MIIKNCTSPCLAGCICLTGTVSSSPSPLHTHLSTGVSKLNMNRIMIRQPIPIRLHKVARQIRPPLRRQANALPRAIKHLIDDLALIRLCGNATAVGIRAGRREGAALDELDPGVAEPGVDEQVDAESAVGVAVVGVAADDHRAAGRVRVDVREELLDAGAAGVDVALLPTGGLLAGCWVRGGSVGEREQLTRRRRAGCTGRLRRRRRSACA